MLEVPFKYAKLVRLWRKEGRKNFVLKAGFEIERLEYVRQDRPGGRRGGLLRL
jgi:hypothetical protein